MIAPVERPAPSEPCAQWQCGFQAILPAIRRNATFAFRRLPREARAEAVQEITVHAMLAYRRLAQLGRTADAHPSTLTRYAVAHYRVGRRTGCAMNCRDIMSSIFDLRRDALCTIIGRHTRWARSRQQRCVPTTKFSLFPWHNQWDRARYGQLGLAGAQSSKCSGAPIVIGFHGAPIGAERHIPLNVSRSSGPVLSHKTRPRRIGGLTDEESTPRLSL